MPTTPYFDTTPTLAIWLALFCAAGCTTEPFRPDTDITVGVNDETAIATDDSAPADVLLISDTHASNPRAPHALLSDGYLADTYVTQVAIRPPHMDQWGSRMVDWVLEQPRETRMIIHLGDAGNIGCIGEFARLVANMDRRRTAGDVRHWYMAPGNHDSLVLGNWGYVASDPTVQTAWNTECSGTGSMDKHIFIDAYRTAQAWDEVDTPPDRNDDYACHDVITHNPAAAARICRRPPAYEYESFIIQSIAIEPDVTMILLDTTQFRQLPSLTHLGGATGGIGSRQFEEVRRWLEPLGDRRVILAGHHPITWLDDGSQRDLEQLIHDFHIAAYISSHTHNAANARLHRTTTQDDRRFLELNVGSLIDWPMEYEYLSVRPQSSPDTTELTLTVAAASQKLEAGCRERWEETRARYGDTAYYTNYVDDGVVTYGALRDQMFDRLRADLAAHQVVLPASYEAHELEVGAPPEELLDSTAQAQVVTDYERCQAIWASEAESQTTLSKWNAALLKLHGWFSPPPRFESGDALRAESQPVTSHRWLIRPR